jgi:hypothetical protein
VAAQADNLIVYGAGMMPAIAETACSGTHAFVAQVGILLLEDLRSLMVEALASVLSIF